MIMNSGLRKNLVIVFIVMGCVLFAYGTFADAKNDDILPILDTTESLFKSMKDKDYSRIWSLISAKSHKIILKDVQKAIAKTNINVPMDALSTDFASGGRYAKEYWDAFLNVFEPDMILLHSKWEVGTISKNEGEVILLYKKSDKPAIIKVFKEDDAWKVGLEETFRPRRMLSHIPWD